MRLTSLGGVEAVDCSAGQGLVEGGYLSVTVRHRRSTFGFPTGHSQHRMLCGHGHQWVGLSSGSPVDARWHPLIQFSSEPVYLETGSEPTLGRDSNPETRG
jgi:hypothetical protein